MEIDDGNLNKQIIIELLQEYTVMLPLFRKLWSFIRKREMKGISYIRRKYKISCRKMQWMLS